MRVIIVGAGLGGLGCAIACRREGFDVVVVDSVSKFLRVGDSIGFGSNSARLLYRWGVGPRMEKIASRAKDIKIYNFDNSDQILGVDQSLGESVEKYGCRQLIGHRGDFHLQLYEFAVELGVKIHMGTTATEYNTTEPGITLHNGDKLSGDVVIIAEGVKSPGRQAVLGYADMPLHSGYAIYRAYGDAEPFRNDPLTKKFFENGDGLNLFLGPDKHGFVCTLRDGKEINAVLTHKDIEDIEESWSKPARNEDVLAYLEDWDPAVRRVWELMPNVIDWKLVYRPCLEKWVADSGLVALMGDAAHPFLPTSTQGASQAIEDGVTIAKCLAKCQGNIPLAMHTYFEIRHDYVAAAQATGIKQRETWHRLHDDGDKAFKETFDINAVAQSNLYLWENDAEKVVEDKWDKISNLVQAKLL